jgi:hypothetical protein
MNDPERAFSIRNASGVSPDNRQIHIQKNRSGVDLNLTKYVLANITIPIEITPDGNQIMHSDLYGIEFTPIDFLPAPNTNTTELDLSQLFLSVLDNSTENFAFKDCDSDSTYSNSSDGDGDSDGDSDPETGNGQFTYENESSPVNDRFSGETPNALRIENTGITKPADTPFMRPLQIVGADIQRKMPPRTKTLRRIYKQLCRFSRRKYEERKETFTGEDSSS